MLKKKGFSKRSKTFEIPTPPPDYDSLPPIFSLKYMNYGSKCCISKRRRRERSTILKTLLKLSQLEWKRISSLPREGSGYEVIRQDQFKFEFPAVVTDEVNILVFRYSDGGRIAGFRINDIYHILMVGDNLYAH